MNDAATDQVPITPPTKSNLVPALLGLNSLLLLAVLAVLLFGGGESQAPPAPQHGEPATGGSAPSTAPASGIGPTLRIADFVVRLRNPEAERFARMAFELEVPTEQDKERLSRHVPKLRDAFLATLSDRTAEELRGSEGIDKAKQSLAAQVRQLVPDVELRGLYITEFVVQ